MKLQAVCEFNDKGFLIHAVEYPGVFSRGASENEAAAKLGGDLLAYLRWTKQPAPEEILTEIVERVRTDGAVHEAQSKVLLEADRAPLTQADYDDLRLIALRSARDLNKLYGSIPNPDISGRPHRTCYYGAVPRTPTEIYRHAGEWHLRFAAEFGIPAESISDIYVGRMQLLAELEDREEYLSGRICTYGDEEWTARKLLRSLIWSDRLHARAMWRTAAALWGSEVKNPFCFI